jgi:hypothetical protein
VCFSLVLWESEDVCATFLPQSTQTGNFQTHQLSSKAISPLNEPYQIRISPSLLTVKKISAKTPIKKI